MRNLTRKPRGGCEPEGCAPPIVRSDSLGALVADYLRRYGSRHRAEFAWYTRLPLADAVRAAALSTLEDGKRHSHQYRIAPHVLRAGASLLAKADLSHAHTFDELHDLVLQVEDRVDGLGEVWTYDVATRIAANRKLEPERVYLHAGTRKGAKALGLSVRAGALDMSDLPREVQRLTSAQAEDFLCIYKDEFGKA